MSHVTWTAVVESVCVLQIRLVHVNRFKSLIILRYIYMLFGYRCHNAISTHNSSERITCARPLTYYQVRSFPPSCRRVAARDMCFFHPFFAAEAGRRQLFIYWSMRFAARNPAEHQNGLGFRTWTKICICVNVVINSKSIDAVWRRRAVHTLVQVTLLEIGLAIL